MKHVVYWGLALIVWVAGNLGIAFVCEMMFESQGITLFAAGFGGFVWVCILATAALYVWGEYVD